MVIAGTFGMWLFYIQHQFEGVYWARHEEWNQMRAVTPLTIRRSLKSLGYNLYDEKQKKLVSFRSLKTLAR
jgi:omega-6 fatty acid desaturase (delta-12 desaturase)